MSDEELNDKYSDDSLINVDVNLDEENKENNIDQNLNNANNNLEETCKVKEASVENITENTLSYCNNNSLNNLHNTPTVTATIKTSSSSLNDTREDEIINVENKAIEEKLMVDSSVVTHNKIEEHFELFVVSNETHSPEVNDYDLENKHLKYADKHHHKDYTDNFNELNANIHLTNDVKQLTSASEVLTNEDISVITEHIVPIVAKRTITNTSTSIVTASDTPEIGNKEVINGEHSDQLDHVSEITSKELRASPNQRNSKSSATQHRVKFTEELPTKNTLLMSSTITFSQPQNIHSIMGGASHSDTGHSGHDRHPGEETFAIQENLTTNIQEISKDPQNVSPHVIVNADVPTKEARAFGTRIER